MVGVVSWGRDVSRFRYHRVVDFGTPAFGSGAFHLDDKKNKIEIRGGREKKKNKLFLNFRRTACPPFYVKEL